MYMYYWYREFVLVHVHVWPVSLSHRLIHYMIYNKYMSVFLTYDMCPYVHDEYRVSP